MDYTKPMKTVVVTGASRGIGRATAERFLKAGWYVIGTSLSGRLPTTRAGNFRILHLNLEHPESIKNAAQAIRSAVPHIDVLVNNAGIILDQHDSAADPEKVRKTLEVDLVGTIDLTEHLLPVIPHGGHIVNVSSSYGAFSLPVDDLTSTGYRIAKAGLDMYTRTLAYRLRDRHITVSALDPGWVRTDMGNAVATETEKPDRDPSQAAEDIYRLATEDVETGCFWQDGKTREW